MVSRIWFWGKWGPRWGRGGRIIGPPIIIGGPPMPIAPIPMPKPAGPPIIGIPIGAIMANGIGGPMG